MCAHLQGFRSEQLQILLTHSLSFEPFNAIKSMEQWNRLKNDVLCQFYANISDECSNIERTGYEDMRRFARDNGRMRWTTFVISVSKNKENRLIKWTGEEPSTMIHCCYMSVSCFLQLIICDKLHHKPIHSHPTLSRIEMNNGFVVMCGEGEFPTQICQKYTNVHR